MSAISCEIAICLPEGALLSYKSSYFCCAKIRRFVRKQSLFRLSHAYFCRLLLFYYNCFAFAYFLPASTTLFTMRTKLGFAYAFAQRKHKVCKKGLCFFTNLFASFFSAYKAKLCTQKKIYLSYKTKLC